MTKYMKLVLGELFFMLMTFSHIEGISSYKLDDVFLGYCNFCTKTKYIFHESLCVEVIFFRKLVGLASYRYSIANGVLVFLAREALKIVFKLGEKQTVFFTMGDERT